MGMNYLKLYVLLEIIGKKKKKNNILYILGIIELMICMKKKIGVNFYF